MDQVANILATYDPISLEEMDSVALLNRTDSKFVFSVAELEQLLEKLKGRGYQVLEINGKRAADYKTLYFDTTDRKFYHMHQNGKTNRIKVRCRRYMDSDIQFLEKKFKNNKGRTIKTRNKVPQFIESLGTAEYTMLGIDPGLDLEPSQWNSFTRITLVNSELKERLTLDRRMQFWMGDRKAALDNTVICEVKQDGVNNLSPVMRGLKDLHIQPMRMSKYCVGMVLLYPDLKSNNFKEKILKLNKIEHDLVT